MAKRNQRYIIQYKITINKKLCWTKLSGYLEMYCLYGITQMTKGNFQNFLHL